MNIPAVPKPETPAFLDEIVVQIQDILKANLSWLDYSFGRSQRLVTTKDKNNYFYPGVHIGYEKYINVFPDQELGNFSFFQIEDPQDLVSDTRRPSLIKIKYSLIFWANLDSIFQDKKDRNTEALKLQILQLLSQGLFLNNGRISVKTIFEKAENIYKEYSLKEVDSQFLMQPYYGLRFEGEIKYDKFCRNNVIFVDGVPASYSGMHTVEQMMTSMRQEFDAFKEGAYDDGLSVDGGIIM